MKRKKTKIADRKSKMSNLRGITPDVQTVTNLKESTDEEEINEFLSALARPAAAAAATYAGEKLVSKMFDEEEVDESTGASSSGAFVAPLGREDSREEGELEEFQIPNINLPLSNVNFSPRTGDKTITTGTKHFGGLGPDLGPDLTNIKTVGGDTDPNVNIGYDADDVEDVVVDDDVMGDEFVDVMGDEFADAVADEVVDDLEAEDFLNDMEVEDTETTTITESVRSDMNKINHLFHYNKKSQ